MFTNTSRTHSAYSFLHPSDHMYYFEGRDYSKDPSSDDQKSFDRLLEEQLDEFQRASGEGRALRHKAGVRRHCKPTGTCPVYQKLECKSFKAHWMCTTLYVGHFCLFTYLKDFVSLISAFKLFYSGHDGWCKNHWIRLHLISSSLSTHIGASFCFCSTASMVHWLVTVIHMHVPGPHAPRTSDI